MENPIKVDDLGAKIKTFFWFNTHVINIMISPHRLSQQCQDHHSHKTKNSAFGDNEDILGDGTRVLERQARSRMGKDSIEIQRYVTWN